MVSKAIDGCFGFIIEDNCLTIVGYKDDINIDLNIAEELYQFLKEYYGLIDQALDEFNQAVSE